MNLIKFIFCSRDVSNLASRLASLFWRFGFTSKRMEKQLQKMTDICKAHHMLPTFPATACVLQRYPKPIIRLQAQGVEFAVHGLVHTDYTQLPFEKQREHFKRAIEIFEKAGICMCGFRSPYLRGNNDTHQAVSQCNFVWESNIVVHWPVVEQNEFPPQAWEAYQKVLELYSSQSATQYRVIPHLPDGHVEIPVSIPDDEACVDRLQLKRDKRRIGRIWQSILEQSHARGEIFTVQLHHERLPFCDEALDYVLMVADHLSPPVFKAQLTTIANWWKQRRKSSFHLEIAGDNYTLKLKTPREATVLCRGMDRSKDHLFFANYTQTSKRVFSGRGILPGIALSNQCHPSWRDFLHEEGFLTLDPIHCARAAYVVDEPNMLTEKRAFNILQAIDSADTPTVRLWRWPQGCRNALCVSGDIDCMTLQDFLWRIWEV
jgi:hypothetical protein